MSRVECMLKLPSLDLVFSSNRGDLETPVPCHAPEAPPPGCTASPLAHNLLKASAAKGTAPVHFCPITNRSEVTAGTLR